ncbi:unnamed protein product [Ixodes pacificus]
MTVGSFDLHAPPAPAALGAYHLIRFSCGAFLKTQPEVYNSLHFSAPLPVNHMSPVSCLNIGELSYTIHGSSCHNQCYGLVNIGNHVLTDLRSFMALSLFSIDFARKVAGSMVSEPSFFIPLDKCIGPR